MTNCNCGNLYCKICRARKEALEKFLMELPNQVPIEKATEITFNIIKIINNKKIN